MTARACRRTGTEPLAGDAAGGSPIRAQTATGVGLAR